MQRIVRSSFEKPCIVGKNVADFFMARLDADNSESHMSQRTQLLQYQNWLHALKSQVCEWLPQCAWSLQDPQLIQAADLLRLIVEFKNTAWAAYQADMAACGHAKVDSMRGLHDALILCSMFGWLPPVRVSMITTLLKPDLPHQCLAEGCSCEGNHMYRLPSSDCLGARWYHHKTARKQGGQPIVYNMPPDLNSLFKIILLPANRVLLEKRGEICRTVFVGLNGKEISLLQWGGYFTRLVTKLGKLNDK